MRCSLALLLLISLAGCPPVDTDKASRDSAPVLETKDFLPPQDKSAPPADHEVELDIMTKADTGDGPCVVPPTACPTGQAKVGMLCSPGQSPPSCKGKPDKGWGTGLYAVCLDNKPPLVWYKCKQEPCGALYFPNSDHRCDNYKGWSTVTQFGGKTYCVYKRTNSTYYNAREEIIKPCK